MDHLQYSPYDTFFDWLIQRMSPQDLLDFEIPEAARAQYQEMLERQNADQLTVEQAAELKSAQSALGMITYIQARASALLNEKP